MEFKSLDPGERRACMVLLGVMTCRMQRLSIQELGEENALVLDFAYSKLRDLIGALTEQINDSYPEAPEAAAP